MPLCSDEIFWGKIVSGNLPPRLSTTTFNAIACEKHATLPDRICQITTVQNFTTFEFFHHEHYETVASTVILGRLCITFVGPWWLQLPGIIIAAGA